MGRRTREQERKRQQLRRNKDRSRRITLKNIIIDDEETLRKALEDEGIHVSLSLEYAVIEKLRRMCSEYKVQKAEKAWQDIAHIPMAATGILLRIESSDEPPEAPKKPRKHESIAREKWWELSPEQQEYYWQERNERDDAAIADELAAQQRDALEAVFNKDTGFHTGEGGRVGRTPNLDRIEGVRRPVPPKVKK
jgi:hypothetical protein